MSVVFDNDRELVRCANIDELSPIPGADNIELATVGGWNVVVRKGEFFRGQDVLFFEVDSCIPIDLPGFEFLAERGYRTNDQGERFHTLKTVRLRGVYSQGLVAPWTDHLKGEYAQWGGCPWYAVEIDGEALPTFATWLGIGKWERDQAPGTGIIRSNATGPFPTWIVQKTDSERVQNLGKFWDELNQYDWIVTEKIDGMSCTAYRDDEGELHVCSRNWELQDDGGTYWSVTRESGIADALRPGEWVQFEIAGPGIQGNPLDLSEKRAFVFACSNGSLAFRVGLLWVPLVGVWSGDEPLPKPAELVAHYDGLKSIVNPKRLAEGVVFHTSAKVPCLGRSTFKVISNKYLERQDKKEAA